MRTRPVIEASLCTNCAARAITVNSQIATSKIATIARSGVNIMT